MPRMKSTFKIKKPYRNLAKYAIQILIHDGNFSLCLKLSSEQVSLSCFTMRQMMRHSEYFFKNTKFLNNKEYVNHQEPFHAYCTYHLNKWVYSSNWVIPEIPSTVSHHLKFLTFVFFMNFLMSQSSGIPGREGCLYLHHFVF